METTNYKNLLNSFITFTIKKYPNFELNEVDKEIYTLLLMYFNNDPKFNEKGAHFSLKKGLLIRGDIGVGKTIMMKTLLDFITSINNFSPYKIISCNAISNEFIAKGAETINKNTVGSFNTYFKNPVAICYDDLGTETNLSSHYSNKINVMQVILMGRYDQFIENGMKTFITTNIYGDEIDKLYGYRVKSRMREMCNDIYYPGEDRRK